jgi:hypothetical protein
MTSPRNIRSHRLTAVEGGALSEVAVPGSVLVAADILQTLHSVPTFVALQEICLKYIVEHRFLRNANASPTCTCRIEIATYEKWLDHVTELQASHISMAIQEARSRDHSAT